MKDKKLNDNQIIIDDGSQCVCSKCEISEHCCPYELEISGNSEHLCHCCQYCSGQCSNEI
jgi:hypothetical protein